MGLCLHMSLCEEWVETERKGVGKQRHSTLTAPDSQPSSLAAAIILQGLGSAGLPMLSTLSPVIFCCHYLPSSMCYAHTHTHTRVLMILYRGPCEETLRFLRTRREGEPAEESSRHVKNASKTRHWGWPTSHHRCEGGGVSYTCRRGVKWPS